MPPVTTLHARVGGLAKSRCPDDPDLADARRDLRAALAEQHIRDLIASVPPPTAEQCARLAALLRPATVSGGAA